jgi:hypothetical protein
MRKGVLAFLVAAVSVVVLNSAPARAMAISTPAALKNVADSVSLTETVCWDCGYYGPPRRYYRPYYRSYYRPYYRSYDRPYYRPYRYSYYDRPYRYYGPPRYYRSYAPPPWVSGPYYSRPRYYHIGPSVYWY